MSWRMSTLGAILEAPAAAEEGGGHQVSHCVRSGHLTLRISSKLLTWDSRGTAPSRRCATCIPTVDRCCSRWRWNGSSRTLSLSSARAVAAAQGRRAVMLVEQVLVVLLPLVRAAVPSYPLVTAQVMVALISAPMA